MGTFVLHQKKTKEVLFKEAEDTIYGIEQFFISNPKRKVCASELWYGEYHKIKRKDVRTQVLAIVANLILDGRVAE